MLGLAKLLFDPPEMAELVFTDSVIELEVEHLRQVDQLRRLKFDDLLDDEIKIEGCVPLEEEVLVVLHQLIPLLFFLLIVAHDDLTLN
jgi:hypothetical protein